jgi:hypothetical protein
MMCEILDCYVLCCITDFFMLCLYRDRELSSRVKLLQLGVRRMIRWNTDKMTVPSDEYGQYRCQHSQKICYLSVVSCHA